MKGIDFEGLKLFWEFVVEIKRDGLSCIFEKGVKVLNFRGKGS